MGLRLMIYDRTCTGRFRVGLTHSWIAGGRLYGAMGRLDDWFGAATWAEALEWLATVHPEHTIDEVQFWGHGQWGTALIDRKALTRDSLRNGAPLRPQLDAVKERLSGPDALWWFRTCHSFGCQPGFDFARAWTDFLGCSAAGHTYIIGPWQSGLHSLSAGNAPSWPIGEGLLLGSVDRPRKALWSRPGRPNTITCLGGAVPEGW